MAAVSKIDARAVQGAVARRGLHVCVGIPAVLLVFGLILRSQFEFLAAPAASEENLRIIGYVLIALAICGLAIGFLIKRNRMASLQLRQRIAAHPGEFVEAIVDAVMPIFIIAAVPAGYGLIFYFLGGDLDTYVLLSVCCPAGLMVFKPKEDEIERLDRDIFGGEESV